MLVRWHKVQGRGHHRPGATLDAIRQVLDGGKVWSVLQVISPDWRQVEIWVKIGWLVGAIPALLWIYEPLLLYIYSLPGWGTMFF